MLAASQLASPEALQWPLESHAQAQTAHAVSPGSKASTHLACLSHGPLYLQRPSQARSLWPLAPASSLPLEQGVGMLSALCALEALRAREGEGTERAMVASTLSHSSSWEAQTLLEHLCPLLCPGAAVYVAASSWASLETPVPCHFLSSHLFVQVKEQSVATSWQGGP